MSLSKRSATSAVLLAWATLVLATVGVGPLLLGCSEECRASLSKSDSDYERFEASTAKNSCEDDEDCRTSGCNGEVCAAEPVDTTCDVVPKPGGTCGCLNGECRWKICE